MSRRLLSASATVLAVAVGIRAAAWIIEPVLVPVTVVLLVVLVVVVVLGSLWGKN